MTERDVASNNISDQTYIKLLEDENAQLSERLKAFGRGEGCDHFWQQHWPCPLEANDIPCNRTQCKYCGEAR